jgi:2-keto-4-pentenoate hydratase
MGNLHRHLADRLANAYSDGPVPPLRDGLDPLDIEGAYTVQAINTERWTTAGRRIVGRKIGLTSKAVQTQLGVDQPDFGVLFDDRSIVDGGVLSPKRVIQPKVEAEIAFIMARELQGAMATSEVVAAAVEYAVTAIEIVDSRIENWKITFADTVADNGSSGFFVLGNERKPLAGLDLYTCGMALEVNGVVESIGTGAACLGHPLNAAAWLARTLAARGESLRAGDVVLTGALGPMAAIKPGDEIVAKIGGLGTARFTYAGLD